MNSVSQFNSNMIYYMGVICKGNRENVNKVCVAKNDKSIDKKALLNNGFWYPHEYCKALKEFNFQDRLNWMVQNGNAYHGMMPKCLTQVEDVNMVMKKKLCDFKIAKECLPSDALEVIGNSLCLLGCEEVIHISMYRSLKDILGKEKFDLLFAWNSTTPLEIGGGCQNPCSRLLKQVFIKSCEQIEPGDICHFSNIQLYMMKHPFGDSRGYNAICSALIDNQPEFLAFGLDNNGVSIEGIERNLSEQCNLPQYEMEFIHPKIIAHAYTTAILRDEKKSKDLVESMKDVSLNFEVFKNEPSRQAFNNCIKIRRLVLPIDRPDLEKIQQLMDASLNDVRKVFQQF